MRPAARTSRFPDFVSVTLADILANGAAIIILMIVITVMIKREEEMQQQEKTEEIAVLLSRDLASSVVMNALPTSPPAMLHDYEASYEDRHPRHAAMPILELHDNYVRNYYTGTQFSRREMLRQNNTLDGYLRSLTRLQAARIRIDIYHIRQFYVFLSVLKDYGIDPRHWHFVGYTKGRGSEMRADEYLAERQPPQLPGVQQGGEEEQDAFAGPGSPMDLPGDVNLDQRPTEPYPYDDLTFDGGLDEALPQPRQGQPGQGRPGERDGRRAEESRQQAQGEPGSDQSQDRRFRSAAPQNQVGQPGQPGPTTELPELSVLLQALFRYMEQAQQEADDGGASSVAQFDLLQDIIQSGLLQEVMQQQPDAGTGRFFRQLAEAINQIPPQPDALIHTGQQSAEVSGQVLAVPLNRSIQSATLLSDVHQHLRTDLPGEIRLDLRFNRYPSIYQGIEVPLQRDSFLLMPTEQQRPEEFRWRVVTAVNAARDDFVVAFVYAAIGEDGQLLLASEENALSISGYRVSTSYPAIELRSEKWLLLLYGIVAALLLLAIFRRPLLRTV